MKTRACNSKFLNQLLVFGSNTTEQSTSYTLLKDLVLKVVENLFRLRFCNPVDMLLLILVFSFELSICLRLWYESCHAYGFITFIMNYDFERFYVKTSLISVSKCQKLTKCRPIEAGGFSWIQLFSYRGKLCGPNFSLDSDTGETSPHLRKNTSLALKGNVNPNLLYILPHF